MHSSRSLPAAVLAVMVATTAAAVVAVVITVPAAAEVAVVAVAAAAAVAVTVEWCRSVAGAPKSPDDSLVGECDGDGAFSDRLLYPLSVDPTWDRSDCERFCRLDADSECRDGGGIIIICNVAMADSALLGMFDGSDWVRGVRDDRLKSCPVALLARGRVFDCCSTIGRSDNTAGGGEGAAAASPATACCFAGDNNCCCC